MASIRKRAAKQYQARVRAHGFPPTSRTFPTRQEAERWADQEEQNLLNGVSTATRQSQQVTLKDALQRYAEEVPPEKRATRPNFDASRLGNATPSQCVLLQTEEPILPAIETSGLRRELAAISFAWSLRSYPTSLKSPARTGVTKNYRTRSRPSASRRCLAVGTADSFLEKKRH